MEERGHTILSIKLPLARRGGSHLSGGFGGATGGSMEKNLEGADASGLGTGSVNTELACDCAVLHSSFRKQRAWHIGCSEGVGTGSRKGMDVFSARGFAGVFGYYWGMVGHCTPGDTISSRLKVRS